MSNLCILKSFHTIYELIILEYHNSVTNLEPQWMDRSIEKRNITPDAQHLSWQQTDHYPPLPFFNPQNIRFSWFYECCMCCNALQHPLPHSNIKQNSSTDVELWKALLATASCQPDRNVKQFPSMQLMACWMTADQPEREIEGGADASRLCKWELQHHQADASAVSQCWHVLHVYMSHSTQIIHDLYSIIMI